MSLVYIAILLVLIPYALLFYYIGDTASIVLGKHICQWLIQDESVLYDDYGRGGGSSSSMDDEGMDDEHVGEEDHFDDLPSPSSSGMELLPLFVNHAGARGSTKDQ